MRKEFPILEYDDCDFAKIEPTPTTDWRVAEHCVLTFFREVVEKYRDQPGTRLEGSSRWETGPVNVYTMDVHGTTVSFVHAWVGAPAVAGIMELVIAHGARNIIACGGCGVLDKEIELGAVLIPTSAVRHEGTSYHYVPPGREVAIDADVVRAIGATLRRHGIAGTECKTWTTDGFYRETDKKIALRKAEGCMCVEMECSAAAAVAQFRNVKFGQLLYAGDNLDADKHDDREWWNAMSDRERLFQLSLEACVTIG